MRGRSCLQVEHLLVVTAISATIAFMFWYSIQGKSSLEPGEWKYGDELEEEQDVEPLSVLTYQEVESLTLEMKRRQLVLMDECHDSGRFKVKNIINQTRLIQVVGRMFIDSHHKLAWCPIYKAASSTWMYVFAAMSGRLTAEDFYNYQHGFIQINKLARKAYPRMLDKETISEFLPKTTRFIIVRHPFERLLSAYRDKLEHRSGREYYYRRYGKHIVKTQRTDNTQQEEPTFLEFLRFLVKTKTYDEHWRPYYWECAPCEFEYQLILKTESLDIEELYLASKFNLLNFLPTDMNRNPVGQTHPLAKKYYSQVPKTLLNQVYQLYEMDFRLFEYTPFEYFKFAKDDD